MAIQPLEFESQIYELEKKLEELKTISEVVDKDIESKIQKLQDRIQRVKTNVYRNLTPSQKVLVARHPNRPYTLDYINAIFKDFVELHGDRLYMDDPAIIAGIATFEDEPCVVVGHQKGRNTKENIHRNFGMPNPEGYRKALRIFKLAEKFKRPIFTFIDTPGAYPGIGAEERGQAEAIARNLFEMAGLKVPFITVVTGEGGSGGALAIAMGNRVLMLEHSIYAVISPEGCASILWKDASYAKRAAEALKLTAQDLKNLKVIDEIIKEPAGGAHRDHETTFINVKKALKKHYSELKQYSQEELFESRYQKFRAMGVFAE
ncbi:MAG: acetyl-CoA carboxylase carboxyltransferase subunit alpha [Deferribacterales bacterium]